MAASISTASDPAARRALLAARRFHCSCSTSTVTLVQHREARRHHQLCSSTNSALQGLFAGGTGRPAELSHRAATWCVIRLLGILPRGCPVSSRFSVGNSSNPRCSPRFWQRCIFLIFVSIVRLYSAVTDRDALFLSMSPFPVFLAAAVLTVDTTFLILFFSIFPPVRCFHFRWNGIAPRSPRRRFACPSYAHGARSKIECALSLSLSAWDGIHRFWWRAVFLFPRFSAGYLGRASFSPSLMSGFTGNVELGQIGEIKKNSAVVMRVTNGKRLLTTGCAGGASRLRLSTAGGGAPRNTNPQKLQPSIDGWIYAANPRRKGIRQLGNDHTVYLEPIATDAIFVPGKVISLKGNFNGETAIR